MNNKILSSTEYIRKHFLFSKGNVIFIHGFNSSWKSNKDFLDKLYKLGYNIFSFDLPNHGNNMESDVQLTFDDYCQYTKKWIVKKQINKNIILIGHSMGGGIVSVIASSILGLKKVILISPLQAKVLSKMIGRAWTMIKTGTMIAHYRDFVKKTNNPTCVPQVLFNNLLSPYVHADIAEGLMSITVEILVIFGENDDVIPAEPSIAYITNMASRCCHLTTNIIPNAKHNPHRTNLDDIMELVKIFLKNNPNK